MKNEKEFSRRKKLEKDEIGDSAAENNTYKREKPARIGPCLTNLRFRSRNLTLYLISPAILLSLFITRIGKVTFGF